MTKKARSLFGTEEAPYAREAIQKCRNLGAKIAIATAESCPDFHNKEQQKFLTEIGIKSGDEMYCDKCRNYSTKNTCPPDCQWVKDSYSGREICMGKFKQGSMKENMLKSIISTVKNKDKVIFFDDQQPNLDLGNRLGIKTQIASDNCDGKVCSCGRGLTKKDFKAGMEKVGNSPEVCIFDIDNTLTRGRNSVEKKEDFTIQFFMALSLGTIIITLVFLLM